MLYRKHRGDLGNRKGATLIVALMILAIISLLAVFSSKKSVMEMNISNNMKMNAVVFHMSEAGLAHTERILMDLFKADEANQELLASDPNSQLVWTFMLNGSLASYPTSATYYFCQGCENGDSNIDGPWVTGGVQVLQRTVSLENLSYTYTVTVWNNNDGLNTGCDPATTVTVDCDGLIVMRSVAQGFLPSSTDPVAESILEKVISADIKSQGAILPGLGQEFANEGKTSSGGDINEISDFTRTSIQ